ncbi:MAG: WG repeat-containing protein [Cyclobacteriaceae bacterium]
MSGYAADIKRALRAIDKEDYEKAFELMADNLEENEKDAPTKWLLAEIFSTDSLEYYQLDSARSLIREALSDFEEIGEDDLEDFNKLGYSFSHLQDTDNKIENLTYNRSKRTSSIRSYNFFLSTYPSSRFTADVIGARDSIAYDSVTAVNTWMAYQGFMFEYPNAKQFDRAEEKYEWLIFQEKTRQGTLTVYEKFIKEHPESPHLESVYESMFPLLTNQSSYQSYLNYVTRFPKSPLVNKALSILYHLDKIKFFEQPSVSRFETYDSLKDVYKLESEVLIPFSAEGKIGFLSKRGEQLVKPDLDWLTERCRTHREDVITASVGGQQLILDRSLRPIVEEEISFSKDLGFGFMMIRVGNKNSVIHKGGWYVLNDVDGADMIGGRFIGFVRDNLTGLANMNGKVLLEAMYDDIWREGNFWLFEKDDLLAVIPDKEIGNIIDSKTFVKLEFDDYELQHDDDIIVYREDFQGLLTSEAEWKVPFDTVSILSNDGIVYVKKGEKYVLFESVGLPDLLKDSLQQLSMSKDWISFKHSDTNYLYNKPNSTLVAFDSTVLLGSIASLAFDKDTTWLLFNDTSYLLEIDHDEISAINHRNTTGTISSEYIKLKNGSTIKLLDQNGEELFTGRFDQVSCFTDSLFKVEVNGKQGVVSSAGEKRVSTTYSFLEQRDRLVKLFRGGELSFYDLDSKVVIEGGHLTMLRVGDHHYLGRKNDGMELLDSLGDNLFDRTYTSIQRLNDSLVWINMDSAWQILNVNRTEIVKSGILTYKPLYQTDSETYWQIYTNRGYGVVNGAGKEIIASTFSNIRMIEDEQPLFLGEHYLPSVDHYVIGIFNGEGSKIFSRAYLTDEYEKFICE